MGVVNAELKRRRALNDKRSKQILSAKCARVPIEFPNINTKYVISSLVKAPRGTIFVSFHTVGYFALFQLMREWQLHVNCIVVDTVIERFAKWRYTIPREVSLSLFLEKDIIRAITRNETSLFIMADVLFPAARNHAVWIYEKIQRYTITWAELAVRHQLNVVALFAKDRQTHLEVLVDVVRPDAMNPYDLVCETFLMFETFLGSDTHLWENYPNVDLLGFPIRYPAAGDGDSLLPLAEFLGKPALNATRAIRQIQSAGAPSKLKVE
jgi:hypothetical protein